MKSKLSIHTILTGMIWLAVIAILITGCSTGIQKKAVQSDINELEQKWGVRPVALRLIGGDHFIDFRYHVIDPDKAAQLLRRSNEPYLIDEATGKVHTVPLTKLGPMRASAVKPKADRNYIVLFGNTQKIIKRGSIVTVVIGDFKAEHMKVM